MLPSIMSQCLYYIINGVISLARSIETLADKPLLKKNLHYKNDSAYISTRSLQQNTPWWAVACGASPIP